jgi:hypothetical protein
VALLKEREDSAGDPGEWSEYGLDPDNGRPIRFRIRLMPEAIERRIMARHPKAALKWEQKKGRQYMNPGDSEAQIRANAEGAEWALAETENFLAMVEDSGAAERYAALLDKPLKVGDVVSLDEHLTPAVKRHVFEQYPSLALWVLGESKARRVKAAEDEDSKD